MSRKRKGNVSVVTVFLDDSMRTQLDQYQNAFGIDTRALAAEALMRAGMSAVPLDTMILEVSRASVKEHRRFFTEGLARFFREQIETLTGRGTGR